MGRKITDIDKHVSQRVRQARLTKGISQNELAGELALTFQQVQKYEKGTNRISAGRLLAIASALGYPVSWFYEGVQAQGALIKVPPSNDPLQELAESKEGLALARAFNRIQDPQMRRAIIATAQSAAAKAA